MKKKCWKPKRKKKAVILNKMSPRTGDDWSWKPTACDISQMVVVRPEKGRVGKKQAKRNKVSKLDNSEFYRSRDWLSLRVRVLEKYECKCMMCGKSPKIHGIVIHVDHIKPRSRNPELSLTFENLQLLCGDCNMGKGNRYSTDWRPEENSLWKKS